MHTPLVSVIIPIYNAADYLDQALKSVRDQTLKDIEIICLNDGSTDDSLTLMKRHAEHDRRIVIVDKANEGYGATCNKGLDLATGVYVAVMEPDDWIDEDMYGEMIAYAERLGCGPESGNPVDVIKTPFWNVENSDTPKETQQPCYYTHLIKPAKQPFLITDAGTTRLLSEHPSIWSALYRNEFIKGNAIRFPEYPGAGWADNPFLVDTLCRADIVYLEKPFYHYRCETEQQRRVFASNNRQMIIDRWNTMLDIMEELNVSEPRVLQAHYRRGFVYLNGIIDAVGFTDEVRNDACSMFNRMNDRLVIDDLQIPNKDKRLFCRLRGIPTSRIPYAQRALHLAKRVVETIATR